MRPRAEQPVVKLIKRDLEFGPATIHDLEESTGVNKRNLRHYLKALLAQKAVHVGGWEQRTGPVLPVYAAGCGRGAPRPKALYPRRGRKK